MYKVIESEQMTEERQRKPRSKKKRIQKKWRKNSKNYYSVPRRDIIVNQAGGYMICHPIMATELRGAIAAQNANFKFNSLYGKLW